MQDANSTAPVSQGRALPDETNAPAKAFWPQGWWKIVDYKIGIVPLPIFPILFLLIGAFAFTGKVPSDILMAIVLLSMGGFTCAELGKRIPLIRNIGAAAIFATFIPSYLAFHHFLPDSILPVHMGRLVPSLFHDRDGSDGRGRPGIVVPSLWRVAARRSGIVSVEQRADHLTVRLPRIGGVGVA